MLSQGDKAGFEAFIARPGSEKKRFNEHEVRQYVDKEGTTMTECWLECEDDATFEVNVVKTEQARGKVSASDWRCRVYVDEQRLRRSPWHKDGPRARVWKSVYQQDPKRPHREPEGPLQFKQTVTVPSLAPGARAADAPPGTIRITLEYGKLTYTGRRKSKKMWTIPEPVLETKAKLARSVGSNFGKAARREDKLQYSFESAETGIWHTFVFKYRHRAVLEVQGVIPAIPQAAPVADDEEEFELLDDAAVANVKVEDVKPRVLTGTQQQARKIRRLEAELRAERARNGPARKRAKVIDLSQEAD